MAALIRLFSRRGGPRRQQDEAQQQSTVKKKNALVCTIMLLDGTDITVDIQVRLILKFHIGTMNKWPMI